jgi:hypothetical protein
VRPRAHQTWGFQTGNLFPGGATAQASIPCTSFSVIIGQTHYRAPEAEAVRLELRPVTEAFKTKRADPDKPMKVEKRACAGLEA